MYTSSTVYALFVLGSYVVPLMKRLCMSQDRVPSKVGARNVLFEIDLFSGTEMCLCLSWSQGFGFPERRFVIYFSFFGVDSFTGDTNFACSKAITLLK